MRALIRGFGWNALNQSATAITSLVVVPIAIERLDASGYGVFTLGMTAAALLQQFDGGLINAAMRFIGISAGRGDRARVSREFTTILCVVMVLSGTLGALLFLLAPEVVGAFQIAARLQPDAIYTARTAAVMIPLGLFGGLLSAVLMAHGQFAAISVSSIATRVAYVAAVAVLVTHDGVKTLALLALLQQAVSVAVLLPYAGHHLDVRHLRLVGWSTAREITTYSARVQAFTVMGLINLQLDALIVGFVLPIRYVAWYNTGATVATQFRSIPLNGAAPIASHLARTMGARGAEAAFADYRRIQRLWVTICSATFSILVGACGFQVVAWLGHNFTRAALVCAILTAGNFINILTGPLTIYLQVIGRPEVEVRYGFLSAALNLVLTLAFIWVGLYGITGATAVGQVIGSISLLWFARRVVSRDIPSFLSPVPVIPCIAAAAIAAFAGYGLLSAISFHGVDGLLVVSAAMAPAAVVFIICLLGPRKVALLGNAIMRNRSLEPVLAQLRNFS